MAQYEPHYTMTYIFNKLPFNPAYAGSKECLDITALYRNQWSGFPGAPKTIVASAHTPFAKDKCGIGLSVTSDRIGMLNNIYAQLAYSYRIKMGDGTLSAGLQAELEYAQIDWTKADPWQNNDPNILTNSQARTRPNFGVGLYYSHPRFFAGLSAPRIMKNAYYDKTNIGTNGDKRTYYGMVGFIFPISKNVMFRPQALISYNPSAPFEWEVNGSFIFARKFWLGASYRHYDSIDLFAQFEATKELRIGFGYDFTISPLKSAAAGSYEIMAGYLFDCCSKAKIDHIRFF